MAFDSRRGVVVLYSGQSGSMRPNDVWEYDGGVGWSNRASPRPGAGLRYPSMVFDQSRNVAVVYGGADDTNGASNWLTQANHWDGTNWSAPPAENGSLGVGPGRRIQFPMLYDSQRQRVVMLYGTGGENGVACSLPGASCTDLWSLTSTGWTRISVVGTTRPNETLFSNSVVYDSKRDRYLLWRPASQSVIETWLFDPNSRTWAQLSGMQVSDNRQKAVLVYDPRRERTLLIGGPTFSESPRYLEVWALPSSAADWSLENPASRGAGLDPAPTILPYAVYDSLHGRVVVFTSDSNSHTWVYGGP